MIRTATLFQTPTHLVFSACPSQTAACRLKSSPFTSLRTKKRQSILKMGASWSSSWNRVSKPAILWTSIDSPPTTKLYDPFQISVGLSEEACQKLTSNGTWHVDFEVDVAHLQKRWELYSSKADQSPEHSLTVRGDLFRQIIEEHKLSNNELCNICAMHFKLETGGQPLGEFSLLADISREGMTECNAAELQRKVYGDTRQNVPDRFQ